MIVEKGGAVYEGSTSQGVFGKQSRPEGHSDDNPLCVENEIKSHLIVFEKKKARQQREAYLGHGLTQVVDAS